MIDAYEIGISIALDNGVAAGIAAIRQDLDALDRAVANSATGLANLGRLSASLAATMPAYPTRLPPPPPATPAPAETAQAPTPVSMTATEAPRPSPQIAAPLATSDRPPSTPSILPTAMPPEFPLRVEPPVRPMFDTTPPSKNSSSPTPPADTTAQPQADNYLTLDTTIIARSVAPPPVSERPLPSRTAPLAPHPQALLESPTPLPTVPLAPASPRPAAPLTPAPHPIAPTLTVPLAPSPHPITLSAPAQNHPQSPPHGEIILDGARLGRWISDRLARAVDRPPSGATSFDPRITPNYAGAPNGS